MDSPTGLIGAQRAIICGAVFIFLGNAMLASGTRRCFFWGSHPSHSAWGCSKPNISVLVGTLYPEGGARRDAGFSLFYMGINVGGAAGCFAGAHLCRALRLALGLRAAGPRHVPRTRAVPVDAPLLERPGASIPVHIGVRSWLPVIGFVQW